VTAHLAAETIGDLDEGLLPFAEADAARAHLAGCGQCQGVRDEMHELRSLLSHAPDPGPMPEAVVARVEAALADERRAHGDGRTKPGAAQAGGDGDDGGGARAATVTPLLARRGRRGPRLLQAAAALVVVAAGGAVAVGVQSGMDGSNDSAFSTAGGAAREQGTEAKSARLRLTASGRAYTTASLRTDATLLLRGASEAALAAGKDLRASPDAAPGRAQSGPPKGAPRARVTAPAADVAACARKLSGDDASPLAVDAGTFDGKPALVYVFAHPQEASKAQVWVVAPSCAVDAAGGVLTYVEVPRQ
jgi:hypothetical protein